MAHSPYAYVRVRFFAEDGGGGATRHPISPLAAHQAVRAALADLHGVRGGAVAFDVLHADAEGDCFMRVASGRVALLTQALALALPFGEGTPVTPHIVAQGSALLPLVEMAE